MSSNPQRTRRPLTLALVGAATLMLSAHQQVRDSGAALPTGTAVVTGVVSENSTNPRPLRRAIVTVTGASLQAPRSAITDDDGRYALRSLPAGRITVTATKRGYVDAAFGARRSGRPGTPIELRAGESVSADIKLEKGAVLTGVIRNQRGVPIPGLRVFALNGQRPEALRPVGTPPNMYTLTDDRGMYRLYDLAPGPYVVAAVPVEGSDGEILRRSVTENDAILGRLQAQSSNAGAASGAAGETAAIAPIFFPGTSLLKAAARISLAAGDVREGLDFTVVGATRVTTIEGIVTGAGASGPIELSIATEDTLQFFALGSSRPKLMQAPGPDGRFKYGTIMPDHYTIWARAGVDLSGVTGRGGVQIPDEVRRMLAGRGEFGATTETLYAMAEVDVSGQPVGGVTLHLQRGSRVSGKVTFDAEGSPLADLSILRVVVRFTGSTNYSTGGGTNIGNTFNSVRPVTVKEDGTFEIIGIPPGAYTLQVMIQPPPADKRVWWPRSATSNDRDLLDTGLAISPSQDILNVTLTMTDRRSEIAGTLQAAPGIPAPEFFVVAMPADAGFWTKSAARRQKFTRPASDGAFSFLDLPPGDYLIAAVTDLDPDAWPSPDLLAAIAPAGVKVSLGINQRVRQDLQIRR